MFLILHSAFRIIKFNVYFCVFYIFLSCSMFLLLSFFCLVLRFVKDFLYLIFLSVSLKFILFFYSLCITSEIPLLFILLIHEKSLAHLNSIYLLHYWYDTSIGYFVSIFFISRRYYNYLCSQYSYRFTYRSTSFHPKPPVFKFSIIVDFNR